MKPVTIAAYVFWAAATAFLGRYELHTDDTGVEVALLFAIACTLGAMHPRHAWQWGLMVGPVIPAVELIFGRPPEGISVAVLLAIVTAIGMAGSYSGALARRVLAHS